MDRYCPECNSTMTPSLVGHLCINCGHSQRFYSNQGTTLAGPLPHPAPSPIATKPQSHQHHKSPHNTPIKPKNKVKSTLKRLMIPELSPPYQSLIGKGDPSKRPTQANGAKQEIKAPIMACATNSHNSATTQPIAQDKQPVATSMPIDTATPNQSSNLSELELALHPQKNTSIWIMLALATLMLIVAAAVLFLIILS